MKTGNLFEEENNSKEEHSSSTRIKIAVFSIVLLIATIIALVCILLVVHNNFSFTEGEAKNAVVTVKEDWLVYEDDSFITADPAVAATKTFEDIYCDLHKANLVKSSKGDLYKIPFEKVITVKDADEDNVLTVYLIDVNGKIYYLTASLEKEDQAVA